MRSSILVLWAAGTRVSLSSMGNWCRPSCLPESSAAWSSAGCVGRIHPVHPVGDGDVAAGSEAVDEQVKYAGTGLEHTLQQPQGLKAQLIQEQKGD